MKLLMTPEDMDDLPVHSIVAVKGDDIERVAFQKAACGCCWAGVGVESVVSMHHAPHRCFPVLLLWTPGQTEEMTVAELEK
jgi:hypothetical protein